MSSAKINKGSVTHKAADNRKVAVRVTPADVEQLELKRKAVALRGAGATYDLIGESLGIPAQRAAVYVNSAYEELRKECKEEFALVFDIEASRLDDLQRAHWPNKADPKHASIILSVMERRARMFGIDAPEKRELTGANGAPLVSEDLISRITDKLFGGSTAPSNAGEGEGSPS